MILRVDVGDESFTYDTGSLTSLEAMAVERYAQVAPPMWEQGIVAGSPLARDVLVWLVRHRATGVEYADSDFLYYACTVEVLSAE